MLLRYITQLILLANAFFLKPIPIFLRQDKRKFTATKLTCDYAKFPKIKANFYKKRWWQVERNLKNELLMFSLLHIGNHTFYEISREGTRIIWERRLFLLEVNWGNRIPLDAFVLEIFKMRPYISNVKFWRKC